MRPFIFATAAFLGLAACESTDLQEVAAAASTDGISRSVTIVNDTSLAMTKIRARNATTGQWISNMFNGVRLQKNSERTIMVDDGTNSCMFSFHASLSNGQAVSNLAVDVCGGGVWRIYSR